MKCSIIQYTRLMIHLKPFELVALNRCIHVYANEDIFHMATFHFDRKCKHIQIQERSVTSELWLCTKKNAFKMNITSSTHQCGFEVKLIRSWPNFFCPYIKWNTLIMVSYDWEFQQIFDYYAKYVLLVWICLSGVFLWVINALDLWGDNWWRLWKKNWRTDNIPVYRIKLPRWL